MPVSFEFLRSIAKSVARCGLNALAGGLPLGDLMLNVAEDAYKNYVARADPEQFRMEMQSLAQASRHELNQEVASIVAEVGAGQSPQVREQFGALLVQVPQALRQSLRHPSDPSGRTASPKFRVRRAEELLPLLPSRLPRFQPGDSPLPGVDWQLAELLGMGAFGEVWKAVNPNMPNYPAVALKFCLDPAAAVSLRNEAALLDKVRSMGESPGIVKLRQTYLRAEPPCLEFEYVAGGDLASLLGHAETLAGGMKPDVVMGILANLANTLKIPHTLPEPIVHRDLKPSNILVTRSIEGKQSRYQLHVADFGIGGVATRQAVDLTRRGQGGSRQTLATTLRGAHTPLYASQQQMDGLPPDPRDDIHALGVIGYQLLIGDLSKGAPHGKTWRVRLIDKGVAPRLIDLLESCFEDDPDSRPKDAEELFNQVKSIRAETKPRGTPASIVPPDTSIQKKDSTPLESNKTIPSELPQGENTTQTKIKSDVENSTTNSPSDTANATSERKSTPKTKRPPILGDVWIQTSPKQDHPQIAQEGIQKPKIEFEKKSQEVGTIEDTAKNPWTGEEPAGQSPTATELVPPPTNPVAMAPPADKYPEPEMAPPSPPETTAPPADDYPEPEVAPPSTEPITEPDPVNDVAGDGEDRAPENDAEPQQPTGKRPTKRRTKKVNDVYKERKKLVEQCSQVLRANPKNLEQLLRRGSMYFSMGQLPKALSDFSDALRIDPRARAAYIGRGDVYCSNEQFTLAIADYTRAIELEPQNPAGYTRRAHGECQRQNLPAALADVESALGLAPENPEVLRSRAFIHLAARDLQAAIADFTRVLHFDPADPAAYHGRGVAYMLLRESGLAMTDFDQALTISRHFYPAILSRGLLWRQLNKPRKAIADFNRFLLLDPRLFAVLYLRGEMYNELGDLNAARADVNEVLKNKQNDRRSRLLRGKIFLEIRQFARSLADFENVVQYYPADPAGWTGRASVRARDGQPDQALADLAEALRLDPNFADAYFERASMAIADENWTSARDDLREFLRLRPKSAEGWFMLALVHLDMNELAAARDACNQSLIYAPAAADTYTVRAEIHAKMGATAKAESDRRKAAQYSSNKQ